MAIESKSPINGNIENNGKFSPKLPVEAEIELNCTEINNIFFIFINKFDSYLMRNLCYFCLKFTYIYDDNTSNNSYFFNYNVFIKHWHNIF